MTGGGEAPTTKVVRLRHPWRVVVAVVLVALVAVFVIDAAQRPAFDWPAVGKYVFDQRITQAAGFTLLLTVLAMIIGIVLGIVLAVMRQSPNPVLKSVAWVYLWVFRGTPVYVQLVFWGLVATIYTSIDLGVPFMEPWVSFPTEAVLNAFWLAVIGLALNESAYMAEIVRAGLLSVDPGQHEAATALGMGWGKTMRRVVLPQAMRVIIPPTGNEVISMLKTTSLVSGVPFTLELYMRSRDISVEIFNPVPLLIVASLWYLAITSVLMVGQYFLEKRFSRGVGARPDGAGGPGAGGAAATGATASIDADPIDPDAAIGSKHGGDAR
ncbi:amino acid ABC transporter permease [Agromyces sp. G08B096]|uniref:Amino acid ABC transporter permease n=1 Tax=Agromyces sp. G08B096 TaxID=3156399 RepID=A0AAU7WAB1_9MICO